MTTTTQPAAKPPVARLALRVEEAAATVGIGRTKAWTFVYSGEWPSFRIGRSVRIPVAGLEEWIARLQEAQSA